MKQNPYMTDDTIDNACIATRNSEVQGPLPASSRKGVAAYIRPVTKAGDTTGVLVLRRSAVRREGGCPAYTTGVVETRGQPLGASNGPDPPPCSPARA